MVLCLLRKRIIHQLRYACLAFIGTGWHQDNAYDIFFFSFNFTFVFFSKDAYLPFYCKQGQAMQGGQTVPYSGNPTGTIPPRANTGNNPSPSPNTNPNPTPNPAQGSSPYGPAQAHLALYGTGQAPQSFYGTTQVGYLTSFNWNFYIGWLVYTVSFLCSSQAGSLPGPKL